MEWVASTPEEDESDASRSGVFIFERTGLSEQLTLDNQMSAMTAGNFADQLARTNFTIANETGTNQDSHSFERKIETEEEPLSKSPGDFGCWNLLEWVVWGPSS